MKKRVQKLHEALTTGAPVRFHCAVLPETKCYGYVVGVGASFALLQNINMDTMQSNGYVALPLTEMRKVRPLPETDFLSRALGMKRIVPESQPDILLLDFPGLLSSINTLFPLITVHTEYDYPDDCYIGRVDRLTDKAVTLREIDPQARWLRSRAYKFKEITRVEFGDGYGEALWMLSEYDRRQGAAQDIETDK